MHLAHDRSLKGRFWLSVQMPDPQGHLTHTSTFVSIRLSTCNMGKCLKNQDLKTNVEPRKSIL